MAKKLDKAIVIDVEATCWESKNSGNINEIIEIGVCVVDLKNKSLEENESILVLPANSTVSEYCTQLTSITQSMLDKKGIAFKEACSSLRKKYDTQNRLWISWGDYDRRQFERQCSQLYTDDGGYKARYPFGPTHLNLKNLFAIDMELSREVGMDEALKMLEIKLEGTHHRGVDDARNIAKILCYILKIGRSKLSS